MRLGACAEPDGLALLKQAGYDYAELPCYSLKVEEPDSAFAPLLEKVKAAEIPIEACNCFVPGHHRVTGPSVDWGGLEAYMGKALGRAAACGARLMVFGSGAARRAPDGFPLEEARAQFAKAARLAAGLAAQRGMQVALEPLSPAQCNFMNHVSQGARLVDELGHPALRLLADLYHMTHGEEPLASLPAAGARLVHAHLATPSLPETKAGLAYDFKGFFAGLKQAGYGARCSLEDNPGFLPEDPAKRLEGLKASRRFYLEAMA